MQSKIIAPCGMNCSLCRAYLRNKDRCPGCRNINGKDSFKYCATCVIRNCHRLKKHGWKFCSGKCEEFPCKRLKSLDKRYRTKYGMSMLENLELIESQGIRKFIAKEKKKWVKNGKIFCVHNRKYYDFK